MATGTKMWLWAICLYLATLLLVALSAAAPAVVAVSARWESAYVSGTVTSHASGLPFAQGSSVTPSGRFLINLLLLLLLRTLVLGAQITPSNYVV